MIDIAKIKKQLPYGAQSEIAKRANVSVPSVNRVLKGTSEDVNILNAIADYLTELNEKKSAVNNRLSSLID